MIWYTRHPVIREVRPDQVPDWLADIRTLPPTPDVKIRMPWWWVALAAAALVGVWGVML